MLADDVWSGDRYGRFNCIFFYSKESNRYPVALVKPAKNILISLYYIKFSGIPSGSKSIKTLSRQWRYHFYPRMRGIIFDQSARSIFARCQALVVFRRLLYCEDFI